MTARKYTLKRYGLTQQDYDDLLAEQEGRCAICRKLPGKVRLVVDHDHQLEAEGYMVVNGLIHQRDNRGLGAFEWSDEVLRNLVDYVTMILDRRALAHKDKQIAWVKKIAAAKEASDG